MTSMARVTVWVGHQVVRTMQRPSVSVFQSNSSVDKKRHSSSLVVGERTKKRQRSAMWLSSWSPVTLRPAPLARLSPARPRPCPTWPGPRADYQSPSVDAMVFCADGKVGLNHAARRRVVHDPLGIRYLHHDNDPPRRTNSLLQ